MDKPSIGLDGFYFTEGPRWHEGALWFSDMHGHRVMRASFDGNDLAGEVEAVATMDFDDPSGLGWLPDGRLLVVAMSTKKLYRLETDGTGEPRLVEHADLSHLVDGDINDMIVAEDGTAYVGHMGYEIHGDISERKSAETIHVTPSGNASIGADRLEAPNGHILTHDGQTLIVAESAASRLTAFDVSPQDGTLSARRTYAQLTPATEELSIATPDGICLDEEGAVWVADPRGRRILRVLEGGEITDSHIFEDEMPLACVLAGDDRRTLCICVAVDWRREIVLQKPTARIDTVRVEVPGAGKP